MKIIIPADIDKILTYLVDTFKDKEFTLYGKTRIVGEEVHLEKLFVPNQESTSSTTDADPDQLIDELDEAGEGAELEHWNMWIHSHHTMGAFWSGTDDEQMRAFDKGGKHFFHMVMSSGAKKRLACFTQYKPFHVRLNDVSIEVSEENENPELTELSRQLDELLEKINELSDSIPEEAVKIEKELDEKNKTPKVIIIDKKVDKKDNLVENWGVPYSVASKIDRDKRIIELKLETVNCPLLCPCLRCAELGHLIILNRLTDKYVKSKSVRKWRTNGHKTDCECEICTAGKHINKIRLLYL